MTNLELSLDLAAYLSGKLSGTFGDFSLGESGIFRMASLEEARELGYGDEDETILIRRESDGAFFEAEADAMVRPVRPAERAQPPAVTA